MKRKTAQSGGRAASATPGDKKEKGKKVQTACGPTNPRQLREVPSSREGKREGDSGQAGGRGPRKKVRVMTYNVLKSSCSTGFYSHCDARHLLFQYRLANQVREIEGLAPDIVCLQEVDRYQEYLSLLGKTYDGIYKKREKGDGCAILYDRARYYVGETRELELVHDTVGLLVQLMPMEEEEESPFLIATTHLSVWFEDSESEEIRVQQTYQLMRIIESWRKEKYAEAGQKHLPTVLCGDFNSTPDSPVYALLTSGRMPSSGVRGVLSTGKPQVSATASAAELSPWKSAYALHQRTIGADDSGVGEPPSTTTLANGGGQVVDYILWPRSSPMRLHSLLEIPPLAEGEGLPSAVYSSDHFSLLCEFDPPQLG